MGTEVLRPHDCLVERIRAPPPAVFHRRRNFYNNNSNNYHYNNQANKPSRSKRKASDSSSTIARRHSSDDLRQSKNNRNRNQNGQVTLLRRGEVLDLKSQSVKASAGNGLGPHPDMVPKQIWINDPKTWSRSRSLSPKPVAGGVPDMYAGSATSVSPSPESLPLPSFSRKKQVSVTIDDSATRDLRRLLRLD